MEDLEQIMRRIHILFAKCELYGNKDEGKIIVPKKEVFRLLEKLNYAVIHMMDEYEGTQESRERGIKDFYQEGEKIRATAQSGADDVYAASLIYTNNMLEELKDVLTDAKEELWGQYARMAQRLDRQAKVLNKDREEIHQQLGAMAQSEKYFKLIERENKRLKQLEEARARQEAWGEEEEGEEYWDGEEDAYEEYEETEEAQEEEDGYEEADGEIDAVKEEQAESSLSEESGLAGGEETDADANPDKADYDEGKEVPDSGAGPDEGAADAGKSADAEKKQAKPSDAGTKSRPSAQKPQKKAGAKPRRSAGQHARMSANLEAEWAEEEAKRKVRKIGTALYQDVGEPYDPPAKHVSYEIKVNQAYFDTVGQGVDLDAEYYQWMEQQNQAAAGAETDEEEEIGEEIQILDNPGIKSDKKEKKKRGGKFGKGTKTEQAGRL